MASTDTPFVFKENILEIISNWNGYPLQDPCIPNPATQAGIVELRCFINNSCPFNKGSRKEDIVVFNTQTMKNIFAWLPKTSQVLTCTDGVEGIHFRPRYVFRHNYIYKPNQTLIDEDKVKDPLVSNFEKYYNEISWVGQTTGWISAARYKAEQSWVISESVFEGKNNSTVEECCDGTWLYQNMNITESSNNWVDCIYDFPANTAFISHKLVQVPTQTNVPGSGPVHWRLDKRTPLFKGEDFFIRFYKKAKESLMNSQTDSNGQTVLSPKFNNPFYNILDVNSTETINLNPGNGKTPLRRPVNYAVTIENPNGQGEEAKFDLYNQAYYIIELGVKSWDSNYFIIIAERSNPIFVMKQYFSGRGISKTLGRYEKEMGSRFIQAESFTMTVRNHLGKIIIEFDVNGERLEPWIITRDDFYIAQDPMTKKPVLESKIQRMTVPRGKVAIWGGNLRCGFVFGPLQYERGEAVFVYPPPQESEGKDDNDSSSSLPGLYNINDVVRGEPQDLSESDTSAVFNKVPCFLPMDGDHHLMLTSANVYLSELRKDVYVPNQSFSDYNLFTQDAQYFMEYDDVVASNSINRSFSLSSPVPGYFFYGSIIKEFSDDTSNSAMAKTSLIAIRKNNYLNNKNTRHHAFDMMIGLLCGDHLFSSNSWNVLSDGELLLSSAKKKLQPISYGNANPTQLDYSAGLSEWLLPNTKTPIMTHLRLIADEGKDPRWNDGTTTKQGISKTPLETQSPYFIDATDHVINYSESWAANSWSEIEHTGSINFYLNRDMVSVENNVTDFLLSLQNKNFYVDIWAGYRNCSAAGFIGLYKMFTGMCHGGQISYEYNKNIMTCKIVDYLSVLKADRFFNAPWFDGMKDINAIWEICQMAGFRSKGKYDPGVVLRTLSTMASKGTSQMFFHHWDGRLFKMEPYALPSGYNRLDQPSFKPNDGESLYDGIVKIAQKSGKTFYFDQFGIARYEDLQDVIEKDYLGTTSLIPLFKFTTNPLIWGGQLVFNKVERTYDVAGISNHIKIISNTPDMHLLLADDISWISIENPNTEGFLGYKKTFFQMEGLFGSMVAVRNAVTKYKVMWRPLILVKFETYGTPLRSNDIISINGEITRVTNVSHEIDAQKNEWWMTVECKKYQTVAGAKLIEDTAAQEWP
jgi:hypothetical protein